MTSSDDWLTDENFSYSEEESVLSLDLPPQRPFHQTSGAPTALEQGAAGHATATVQGAVVRATTAVRGTAGYVAAMRYYFEFEDAAVENMAASDPHQVSHGLPHLPHSEGFGEDGSLDVEKLAVDVDACKADNFVDDEAEKVLEGEKRGGGGQRERRTWGFSCTQPATGRPVWRTCWTRRQTRRRRVATACIFVCSH